MKMQVMAIQIRIARGLFSVMIFARLLLKVIWIMGWLGHMKLSAMF